MLYTDNFRSARITDSYTLANGGIVSCQPTFTQHGFRYIALSGLTVPPEAGDVVGVVLADLVETGGLRTPDPIPAHRLRALQVTYSGIARYTENGSSMNHTRAIFQPHGIQRVQRSRR